MFEYLHFVCDQIELEALLKEAGRDNWRLHTCEPFNTVGPKGSGPLQAFVVMDRMVEPNEPKGFTSEMEGIAMVG